MSDKKLFIAMPYGLREDRLDHYNEKAEKILLNFDEIWQGVIQPAIPDTFTYKRADELRQPGIIDKLYIEWLFNADVVIADLTFGNPNVYYELGMRHVFSKKGTVLIAHENSQLPFDVRNQYVLYYNYFKAPSLPRFHKNLSDAINNAYNQKEDSPVHILLPGINVYRTEGKKDLLLQIATLQEEKDNLIETVAKFRKNYEEERYLEKVNSTFEKNRLIGYYNQIKNKLFNSVTLYETLGIKLRKVGLVNEAIKIFKIAVEKVGDDSDLYRELGFSYRLLGNEYFHDAEEYFNKALKINEQDPELLGMIGGLYKRKGELEQAKLFYEKAYTIITDDIYSIINLAFLQLVFSETEKSRNNYKKIIDLTDEKIKNHDVVYWDFLTRGQAMLILGDIDKSKEAYAEAIRLKVPIEDLRSEFEQLQFLKSKNLNVSEINAIEKMYFMQFQ